MCLHVNTTQMPATANAVHAFLQREILHMFLITTLYNIIILCLSTEWFLEFNLLSLFLLLAEGTKIRWHEADSEVVGMNEKRAAKWKGKKPNAKWQDLWRHSGTFNPAASSSNQMNVLRVLQIFSTLDAVGVNLRVGAGPRSAAGRSSAIEVYLAPEPVNTSVHNCGED